MKYRTGDLSKILSVSSNTIRRYEEKGYLHSIREEKSDYRYFDNSDVTKMVFISKYRKIGFSHDQIAKMFQSDFFTSMEICKDKLAELDRQIATLTAVRHMLKDDIVLMNRVKDQEIKVYERNCVGFYYVSYQKNGKLLLDKQRIDKLYDFMYICPEIKYCYIFRKENILKGKLIYEEAIAIKKVDAAKFAIAIDDESIESYDEQPSLMRIVKVPIDFTNEDTISEEEARKIIYDDLLDMMKDRGCKLAGDAIAIKIGFSKEGNAEEQYLLMSMPVEVI